MSKPRKNLVGLKVNRLSVVDDLGYTLTGKTKPRMRQFYKCICDCGCESVVLGESLNRGAIHSCGCYQAERSFEGCFKHGCSKDLEYSNWRSLIDRCYNPQNRQYPRYGGRGISVCEKWLSSYEIFKKDMGNKPSKNHSIDRIDVNGNYCKENCRWATPLEQNNNTRANINIEYSGLKKTMSQWARYLGVNYQVFCRKYRQDGWGIPMIIYKYVSREADIFCNGVYVNHK